MWLFVAAKVHGVWQGCMACHDGKYYDPVDGTETEIEETEGEE